MGRQQQQSGPESEPGSETEKVKRTHLATSSTSKTTAPSWCLSVSDQEKLAAVLRNVPGRCCGAQGAASRQCAALEQVGEAFAAMQAAADEAPRAARP